MCGIVGTVSFRGDPADEKVVLTMARSLAHRGPDDEGVWVGDGIGLGHTRLSVMDLSDRAHQPFVTADGQGVLTYNGEIYNFRELREELEREGVEFTSSGDTEVVLYALHEWGVEPAVARFNGMFAFAYYDRRNRTLWLGRDPAGIKPLYIAHVGDTLLFASEMKAILAHPGFHARPDMHALTTFVHMHGMQTTATPFEGVQALRAGTVRRIRAGRDEEIVHFDLIRDLDVTRLVNGSTKAYTEWVAEFEDLLSRSVEDHLASDAPLAVMCSGGLDSSLTTALAAQHKPDLTAYVADIEGAEVPEADKAEMAANHIGVRLRRIQISREEFLRTWPRAVLMNDQPCYVVQHSAYLLVLDAVSRDGYKVILTGEGSDELFGGYRWLVLAYKEWRSRRRHERWIPDLKVLRKLGDRLRRRFAPGLEQASMDPFMQESEKYPEFFAARRACAIDGGVRLLRRRELFESLREVEPIEERAFLARSFEDFYHHLALLLVANDKMGMASSVEVRVPFLDRRVIDFGLHLPCSAKYRDGEVKRIVKSVGEPRLPREIVFARKEGFPVPRDIWHCALPLLDGGWVENAFKWAPSGRAALRELVSKDVYLGQHLVSTELWARQYLGGESAEQIGEELVRVSTRK